MQRSGIGGLACALAALGLLASEAVASPIVVLHAFNSTDGKEPLSTPIQSGSLLYGTTSNFGTIFQYDTATSTFTSLHRMTLAEGFSPRGALALVGTSLYGMTNFGGSVDGGTLFRFNTATNTYSVLHNFTGGTADGYNPYGSVLASGSFLYGMTYSGGASNAGTLFRYNTSNSTYAVLKSFSGGAGDGANPYGSLIQSGSLLYGMTSAGGSNNQGTVFQYDTSTNTETNLYSFAGIPNDGSGPRGSLLLSGSILYGMTRIGGAHGQGTIFQYDLGSALETVLYSFGSGGSNDGIKPDDSLILVGSTLYGTTENTVIASGGGFAGTAFQYDLNSHTETVLHNFAVDADTPEASLLYSNGNLYGTVGFDGSGGGGILFSLAIPEPSSGVLVGFLGAAIFARRRRRFTSLTSHPAQ